MSLKMKWRSQLLLLRKYTVSNIQPLHITRLKALKWVIQSRARNIGHLMFSRYLLFTNVGISISLSGVGDTLEQHYEMLTSQKDDWDIKRTMRMSVSGMTVGVLCHHWYRFLDRRIPGRTFNAVIRKVLVDQVVCSPLCISIFFITLGALEGCTWEETKKEMKSKAMRLYAAEWVVWPPAQVINFYLLPLRFRVLYDNTISLGYDVYTSYVKHDDEPEEDISKVVEKNQELTDALEGQGDVSSNVNSTSKH